MSENDLAQMCGHTAHYAEMAQMIRDMEEKGISRSMKGIVTDDADNMRHNLQQTMGPDWTKKFEGTLPAFGLSLGMTEEEAVRRFHA